MNLPPLHTLEWLRPGEMTEELPEELAAMLNKNPFTEEDEEEFGTFGIQYPGEP